MRHAPSEEGALKRHQIAFLILTLAGCGGGNGMPDSGAPDTGVVDSGAPDTSMPTDSGVMDTGVADSGMPTPRRTGFITTSGGGEMTGGGFQMRITVGVTPAGRTTAPGTDLSLGSNAVLR